MKANVGGIDRILRILVGVALLAWLALGEGTARYWGAIGIIPLLTGTLRFCPVYLPFGMSTCPMKAKEG